MQGIDYHLITGRDTPLRILSPQFFVELSNEHLDKEKENTYSLKSSLKSI